MKKNFIILFIYIAIVASFLLVGCGKNNEKYIDFDYVETYYISESQNRIPYPFAFHEKVTKVEITNIQASKDIEIHASCDVEEEPVKVNEYYMSGVIFTFSKAEDMVLNSFTIKVNDKFTKDINLDLNIKNYDESIPQILYPMSIPMVCNLNKELSWKFASNKDIKITNIKLIASIIGEKEIKINDQIFDRESGFRLLANTEIAIVIAPDYSNAKTKLSCGYLSVEYIENGVTHSFQTELTSFNSEIKILENR